MTGGFSSRSVGDKRKDLFVIFALVLASAVLLAFFFISGGLNSKIALSLSLCGFSASVILGGTYPVYYVYSVEGDDLSVLRVSGRTSKTVCLIGITEITGLETRRGRDGKEKTRRYDYRGALFTRETLRVAFDDGYEKGVLLLTCDDAFIAGLTSLYKLYGAEITEQHTEIKK